MGNDDNTLDTLLWLAAGGATGYAAGRWLVASHRADGARTIVRAAPPQVTTAFAAPGPKARATAPRALAAGPSGSMQPIDPYTSSVPNTPLAPAGGPSGSMQPIDPYAPSSIPSITITTVTSEPNAPRVTSAAELPPMDGPITRPSQLATSSTNAPAPSVSGTDAQSTETDVFHAPETTAAPSRGFATAARVRRFDRVFDRYRGALPIEYVRALVERESDGQPNVRAGSSVGLMQIVPVVLADYNKRHGTHYQSEQLVDPAVNVAIGCELLRLIIESYRKNHPRITTLRADWNNVRFVELLTFGWNAGFSEAGGVGRVATYLEGLGAVDITIDQVSDHAKLAGASKHLSNPAKVRWCKSVAALYMRERATSRRAPTLATS